MEVACDGLERGRGGAEKPCRSERKKGVALDLEVDQSRVYFLAPGTP